MRAAFNRMGLSQFGSGWVFVTVEPSGKLGLAARANQDTPLMEGGRVLLGNDVWEHAYYLNYRNRRADYLAAWWNVVNWDAVAARYVRARAGTLMICSPDVNPSVMGCACVRGPVLIAARSRHDARLGLRTCS